LQLNHQNMHKLLCLAVVQFHVITIEMIIAKIIF